jgi:tRNA (mo5U34)-methyltransferase
VFFLGVLYHLEEPLTAIKRIYALTREMAIIETHAIYIPGHEDIALLEFYENEKLNKDATNHFGFNAAALGGLCRQAGFRSVKITSPYPPELIDTSGFGKRSMYRLTVQAFK